MKYDNYELTVIPGNEQSNGQVYMQHGAEYALLLKNHQSRQCDAEVSIDGKLVGIWRIHAYRTIRLERPVDVEKKFIFLRLDSPEGNDANLPSVNRSDLGLISVQFIPEKERIVRTRGSDEPLWPGGPHIRVTYASDTDVPMAGGDSTYASAGAAPMQTNSVTRGRVGGTGLGAHSDQRFYQANQIDRDMGRAVTIHLRLVEGSMVSELRPMEVTKQAPKMTPIPPMGTGI